MRRQRRDGYTTNCHRHSAEPLTGQCDHCSWYTVQDSYPKIVKAYQDHLRAEHHEVWVRT